MDMKRIVPWFALGVALLGVIMGLAAAHADHTSTAVACFGLAVVFLLFTSLPFITEIQAFGVQAKLDRTVERAETILEKLQAASLATARGIYKMALWSDSKVPWGERRKLVQSLDVALLGPGAKTLRAEFADELAKPLSLLFVELTQTRMRVRDPSLLNPGALRKAEADRTEADREIIKRYKIYGEVSSGYICSSPASRRRTLSHAGPKRSTELSQMDSCRKMSGKSWPTCFGTW